MKTTLCAVAAALLLSACGAMTSTNGSSNVAAASTGGTTMYCWKRSLSSTDGTLLCNWEASSSEACKSIGQVALGKSSLAGEPRDAGRCTNGEWLVAVTTK